MNALGNLSSQSLNTGDALVTGDANIDGNITVATTAQAQSVITNDLTVSNNVIPGGVLNCSAEGGVATWKPAPVWFGSDRSTYDNTGGNVIIGEAIEVDGTITNSVVIGYNAGKSNNSVVIGQNAVGNKADSINNCVVIGNECLVNTNYDTKEAVFIGYATGPTNPDAKAAWFTCIGHAAFHDLTSPGDYWRCVHSVAVGTGAGSRMTESSEDCFLGSGSGSALAVSSNNTFVGCNSCSWTEGQLEPNNSNACVALGALTTISQNLSNAITIGYQSNCNQSNMLQLGNSQVTPYSYVGLAMRSDLRDIVDMKDVDIKTLAQFARQIPIRSYRNNFRDAYTDRVIEGDTKVVKSLTNDGSRAGTRTHYGIIGQDIQDIINNKSIEGLSDFPALKDSSVSNSSSDTISVDYSSILMATLALTKELDAKLNLALAEIELLKSQIP
jgi:hypothetical protein